MSSRTRSRVEIINPLEAEIVSRHPIYPQEVGSSSFGIAAADLITLSPTQMSRKELLLGVSLLILMMIFGIVESNHSPTLVIMEMVRRKCS